MLSNKVFTEHMALLCEIFQREATDLLLKAYYMVLRDMTDEQFKEAVSMIMDTKTFNKLPLPAEILTVGNPDSAGKAELALAKLEKAVDTYGKNYSIKFDDPIIHVVVDRLGGWEWITTQLIEEWKWIRKDFVRMYDIYSKMKQASIPERLIGYAERHNSAMGYEPEVWQDMIVDLSQHPLMIENEVNNQKEALQCDQEG